MRQTKDFIDRMMEFESGMLNDAEIIEMFSDLIKSGASWSLQGHYGRAASAFIEGGWLDKEGNILKNLEKCSGCNKPGAIHKMSCPTKKATVFITDEVKAYYDQMDKEVHQNRSNLNE
jgi:hypothetical protein